MHIQSPGFTKKEYIS